MRWPLMWKSTHDAAIVELNEMLRQRYETDLEQTRRVLLREYLLKVQALARRFDEKLKAMNIPGPASPGEMRDDP